MSADKSQVMSETLNLKQLMDNPDEYVDNTKYIREVKAQREDLYRCRIEKLKAELFEFRKESPEEFKDKLKSESVFTRITQTYYQQSERISYRYKLIQIQLIEDGMVDQHEDRWRWVNC
jgi:hypothetical protein